MGQIERRNKVVPIMERLVKDDMSFDEFRVGIPHGSISLVHLVHNFRDHFQASGRDGAASSLASVFHGQERMSVPRFRYLGEEAVLDRVELGTVWRIVHDKDTHADTAGKVDKVLLDNVMSARVGSAAVAEHREKVGVGVERFQMPVPNPLDVAAHELGGVVVCSNGEVTRVVGDVVDAVGDNRPGGEGREVMVEGLRGRRAVDLPRALEVSNHLLLLGVYADDGYAGFKAGRLRHGDFFELWVSVIDHAHRQTFDKRPSFKTFYNNHLADNVVRHNISLFEHQPSDLRDTDVKPLRVLVLGKSRQVHVQDFMESRHPFGMCVGFALGTASRLANSAAAWQDLVVKFKNPLINGVLAHLQTLAQSPHSDAHGTRRDGRKIMSPVKLIDGRKILHLDICQTYWRIFRIHCNKLRIIYKDTKFSPIINELNC